MAFFLSPLAENAGFRLEAFDTIGSTNACALERAKAGDPGNLWVVSRKQESGRGRRGRAWSTSEGNLAATLLVRGAYDVASAATLGFVAGLSLSDALDAVLPESKDRIELKWPNDVLVNAAKLSGILLESVALPDGDVVCALGIGVNVTSRPEGLSYPVTSLAALGSAVDAETLFLALSDAWMANVAVWEEGRGLDAVRRRWLDRAAGLGGPVAVRIDDTVVDGTFETLDEACRFVVRRPDGSQTRISAGDVYFGAAASAAAAPVNEDMANG